MSGTSTVWEDTDGSANKCRCALAMYFMNVLSSSYGIIIDCAINVSGHGKNVVDGMNSTHKRYLKEQIEIIGILEINDT